MKPRPMLRFSLLLLILVIPLVALVPAEEARGDERILDFQGQVECFEDASIKVQEKLKAKSEGTGIRHGIFRDILLRNWAGRPSRIEVLHGTLDGSPVATRGENFTQGIRIYLGDPDTELPPGIHVFTLVYRMSDQVGNLEDRDEIYWNVTGNDWSFPIDRVSCLVIPPPGARNPESFKVAAYSGHQGSRGKDFRYEVDDSGVRFETTRPLVPGEGLTVAVGWPKGAVTFGSQGSRNRGWLAFAAGMGLVLLYYLLTWHFSGRDAPRGVITPLFELPGGMTPAEARRVSKMGLDVGAFPAELVHLAVKGILRIEETEGEFTLSLERSPDMSGLAGHQKALVNSILATAQDSSRRIDSIKAASRQKGLVGRLARMSLKVGDIPASQPSPESRIELPLTRSRASGLQSAWGSLRKALEVKQASRNLFSKNTGKWILGLAGSLLALAGMFYANDPIGFVKGGGIFLAVWLSFWTIGVVLLVTGTIIAWGRLLRAPSISGTLMALFFTLFTIPFLAAEAFVLYQLALVTYTPVFKQMLPAITAVFATVALFKGLLKRYSAEGQLLRAQVEGYRLYLSMAEEGPLRSLSAPSPSPELFERHLPFAMALEVEEAWAGRFADQLGAAYTPDWYRGSSFAGSAGFVGGFSGAFSGAVSSASSTSSGGSGGGGSSGGGGGGGGGGGW